VPPGHHQYRPVRVAAIPATGCSGPVPATYRTERGCEDEHVTALSPRSSRWAPPGTAHLPPAGPATPLGVTPGPEAQRRRQLVAGQLVAVNWGRGELRPRPRPAPRRRWTDELEVPPPLVVTVIAGKGDADRPVGVVGDEGEFCSRRRAEDGDHGAVRRLGPPPARRGTMTSCGPAQVAVTTLHGPPPRTAPITEPWRRRARTRPPRTPSVPRPRQEPLPSRSASRARLRHPVQGRLPDEPAMVSKASTLSVSAPGRSCPSRPRCGRPAARKPPTAGRLHPTSGCLAVALRSAARASLRGARPARAALV